MNRNISVSTETKFPAMPSRRINNEILPGRAHDTNTVADKFACAGIIGDENARHLGLINR